MHLLFVDESGTPHGPNVRRDRYFVIGGIIIPDGVWKKLHDAIHGMKVRRKLVGELKWRFFAPTNVDATNPMRSMQPSQRDEIRGGIYAAINSIKSVKTIACVASIEVAYKRPHVRDADDLYHNTYKPISERFQYHLQEVSRTVGRLETGIIVADHRGSQQDARLRDAHERLIRPGSMYTSEYPNLVESLFFLPSDLSIGIQLADMIAGAVWRKFEKSDDTWYKALEPSLREDPAGKIDGYGVIRFPRGGWR